MSYNYTTISISKELKERLLKHFYKDSNDSKNTTWNEILTSLLAELEDLQQDT